MRNGSEAPVDRELLAAVDECRRTKARAENEKLSARIAALESKLGIDKRNSPAGRKRPARGRKL